MVVRQLHVRTLFPLKIGRIKLLSRGDVLSLVGLAKAVVERLRAIDPDAGFWRVSHLETCLLSRLQDLRGVCLEQRNRFVETFLLMGQRGAHHRAG